MTDADCELAALLASNPELRVIGPNVRDVPVCNKPEPSPSEDAMQAAVIAWADSKDHPALRWLFHVPNGGYRDAATGGRMKAAGVRPGVPDLLLPWVGDLREWAGLAIEMKRKPNKPTPEQAAWLEHLEANGWRVAVCYSADEAIGVLREYLGIA